MADFMYNIAKGRLGELHSRVKVGDPAAARFYMIPVNVAAVTDATLKDLDDFAAIITAGVTERAAGGWNRKTLVAADLSLVVPDDVNDRFDYDIINDQTWVTVAAANDSTDLILCYASVGAPTNAQLMPVGQWDFPVTTDGSDIVAVINAAGYFRAS